ncbi:MAG: hypothetical protein M1839_006280 [Geoglossum umbratile]|nr:MAG: hypothetical protein M1839_006280 [Geoglossum umbratile]
MSTQLTVLSLHPDTPIEDSSTEAGRVWKSTLETIAAQPGCEHVFWGRQVEDPSTVQLHINWNNISSRQAFTDSPAHKPFATALSTLLASPPKTFHSTLDPHPTTAVFAPGTTPVTELCTFYFALPLSPEAQSAFDETITAFSARVASKAEGHTAAASGWIVEELDNPAIGKAKAFFLAYGWKSIDAHMKYRDTQDFKETIGGIREKIGAVTMYHVAFKEL